MKISIIIPVYNAEDYLPKCLESIIGQTYHDIEIIIINDGSTDRSSDICKDFAAKDERIVYIEQENQGVVSTRRRGINVCSGDYLTFVDADDYIEADTYRTIVDRMGSTRADMVLFDIIEEDDGVSIKSSNRIAAGFYTGDAMINEIYPKMLSFDNFFSFGILPTVFSKLFRSDFLKKSDIIIDDSITFGEDVALTFQAMIRANSVQIMRYAPYHYIRKKVSMTWDAQDEGNICVLENTLRDSFHRVAKAEIMNKQLQEYITFVRLLKRPQSVLPVEKKFMDSNKRTALYGAGGFGQSIYHQYGDHISLWVDKEYLKYEYLDGGVVSVDELIDKQEEYDRIFIAIINEELCASIKESLEGKGIRKEIVYYENSL